LAPGYVAIYVLETIGKNHVAAILPRSEEEAPSAPTKFETAFSPEGFYQRHSSMIGNSLSMVRR
jgi:hypothetical protein